jgi:N-acyl homoserine lactone hydrolase
MKLYLLHLAYLQPLGVPVPGYLIQTDDGTNILVDTGFPHSFIEQPPGPLGPLSLEVEMRPEDHVVSRLASIGLQPADIDLLVCTHFDADHAGNHHLFPHAELVVQRRHYEVARAGDPRYAMIRDSWDAPGLRYRLVDGDTTLLPGVELLESSGHVPGHQSVLVRLPETGPELLTIDAIPHASMRDATTRPILPNDEDEAETRASTRKLMEIAQREGVTLIIFGHDNDQWPTLRHAPEFHR